MELKEQLRADMVGAMKSGDTELRDVLRMQLAAIQQVEVDGQTTLGDEGVQDVLRKQVKQRQESIADFERAGRAADVAREQSEIAILERYLPQMMSREEIAAIAAKAVADVGATSAKDMGTVMGRVMPQVKGRADGRLVSEVVRELLQ